MKMPWKKLVLSCVALAAPTVLAQDLVSSEQAVPVEDVVLVDKATTADGAESSDCNIIIGCGNILGNISGNIVNVLGNRIF